MSGITRTEFNYRLPNGQTPGLWSLDLAAVQSAASRARMALEAAGAVNQKIEILKRDVETITGPSDVHSEVWANPMPDELPTLPEQEPTA